MKSLFILSLELFTFFVCSCNKPKYEQIPKKELTEVSGFFLDSSNAIISYNADDKLDKINETNLPIGNWEYEFAYNSSNQISKKTRTQDGNNVTRWFYIYNNADLEKVIMTRDDDTVQVIRNIAYESSKISSYDIYEGPSLEKNRSFDFEYDLKGNVNRVVSSYYEQGEKKNIYTEEIKLSKKCNPYQDLFLFEVFTPRSFDKNYPKRIITTYESGQVDTMNHTFTGGRWPSEIIGKGTLRGESVNWKRKHTYR